MNLAKRVGLTVGLTLLFPFILIVQALAAAVFIFWQVSADVAGNWRADVRDLWKR